MKKIFFSTFLVFALVFSFGNPANAQVSSEQTVLQNLYQQLDAIRIQLGGLVSKEAIKSVTPIVVTPPTAFIFNACNGTSQSAFSLCQSICAEAGGSWGVSSDNSGVQQGCYASESIGMPQNTTTPISIRGNVDTVGNNLRTNPSCPLGQIWSVSIGACVLGPITVSPTAAVVDVTGSPLDKENLQDERVLPVSHVVNLQLLLNRLGFNVGLADGKAGPKTQSQIRAFQAKYGFPLTGIANYTALNQANRVIAGIQNTNSSGATTVVKSKILILQEIFGEDFSNARYVSNCKQEKFPYTSFSGVTDHDPSGGEGSYNVYNTAGSIVARCTVSSMSVSQ